MEFEAGTQVEIMYQGDWTGPFVVTDMSGRTKDHLVLRTLDGGHYFEVPNDAPFNIRPVSN